MSLSEFLNNLQAEEQDLLTMIKDMTDNETALKAKNLYHSKANKYTYDVYVCLLVKLCDLLNRGVPKDKALNLISSHIYGEKTGQPESILSLLDL